MRERAYLLGVPDGSEDVSAAQRRKPGSPARPHSWAVLAVALGLMAVVIAATATSGRRHGRTDPVAAVGTQSGTAGPASDHPPGTQSTGTTEPNALSPTSGGAASGGGTTGAVRLPEAANPGSASATVEPTTVGVTTTTATVSPVTASAAPTQVTEATPGNLEYPTNISAIYQVSATAPTLSALTTFSGTPALELALTCTGGHVTQEVTSGTPLTLNGASGSCTMSVALPSGVESTVSYSVALTGGTVEGG